MGRRSSAAVAALTIALGALTTAGAGAGAAPAQVAEPAVTVTPTEGLELGDRVTVSGTGLSDIYGHVWVMVCRPEAADLGEGAGVGIGVYERFCDTYSTHLAGGAATMEAVLTFTGTAYVGMSTNLSTENFSVTLVPLEVAEPAGSVLSAGIVESELATWQRPAVHGIVAPSPAAVSLRTCTGAVPDPLDTAAVGAACGRAFTAMSDETGRFDSPYGMAVRPGDTALWLGAEVGGQPVATVVPFAAEEGNPTFAVTPTTGLHLGDTVTATSAGTVFFSFFIPPELWVCTDEVALETGEALPLSGQSDACVRLAESGQGELSVRSPRWRYVVFDHKVAAYHGEVWEDNARWVPVEVVAPAEPNLHVDIGAELAEGAPLDLTGSTSPGTDAVSVRFCDSVPADAYDLAAVDAACEPATTLATAADDGFALPGPVGARLHHVAVWVGAEVEGRHLARVVPFTVLRPSLTLSPDDELTVNQAVRVTPGLLVADAPYDVRYCEGAVLADGGATLAELTNQCGGSLARLWSDEDGRIPAFELRVPSQVRVGPSRRPVSCTAAPGACALVIENRESVFEQPPWVRSGGVPLLIGAAPALPVIVPGAGSVAEPQGGSVTATMPVTLSSPMAEPVTVRYQSFHTASSPPWAALPSADYVPTEGTLTFAPGQTTATIPIEVLDDIYREPPEMALVGLTQPTGGVGVGGYGGLGGVVITDTD